MPREEILFSPGPDFYVLHSITRMQGPKIDSYTVGARLRAGCICGVQTVMSARGLVDPYDSRPGGKRYRVRDLPTYQRQ